MKRILLGILAVVAVAALGWWLYGIFFPSDEELITKHLTELAGVASVRADQGRLKRLASGSGLRDYFTQDVELKLSEVGSDFGSIRGRDQIMELVMASRMRVGRLDIQFLDIRIQVTGKEEATALLTATAKTDLDDGDVIQRLKFNLRKVDGQWLVSRVETLKALGR